MNELPYDILANIMVNIPTLDIKNNLLISKTLYEFSNSRTYLQVLRYKIQQQLGIVLNKRYTKEQLQFLMLVNISKDIACGDQILVLNKQGVVYKDRFKINIKEPFVQISGICDHYLLLTKKGKVYSFGANYCGKLGLNLSENDKIFKPTKIPNIKNIVQV